MKIAYINTVSGYGSTGKIVQSLAHIEGVQGRVYYSRKENLSDVPSYRFTKIIGNGNHILQTFLFDNHGFCNTNQTKNLIEQLKAFQPDLIHLHNLHGYYLNVEVLFAYLKEFKIPVLWTMHDCWAFTGHCAHYESVNCEKWKTTCTRPCPALSHYPPTFNSSAVQKNFLRKKEVFTSLPIHQLTIVTPSIWLQHQLQQSFFKDYTIRVIQNGIDLTKWGPTEQVFRKEHSLDNQFLILAVASNWYKEKGFDDLVSLSFMLREDEKLIIVGTNTSQAKKFNAETTIGMKRTNSIEELADLYSSANVLVNPTYEDTFPTVNLEAQACGTPVITYPTGGSTEMIRENTGIVTSEKTVESLLSAIQVEKTPFSMSEKACIENASRYSKEVMLSRYQQIYKEILCNR